MQMHNTDNKASMYKAEWNDLVIEYGCLDKIGSFDFVMPNNAISIAFTPHEKVTWSVDGGKQQTTALPAGSVFLYSGREFVWHQRYKESEYMNLLLEPTLLRRLANDSGLSSNIELEHKVIFPDATILHVAQLLKSEAISGGLAGNLYVESLRNLLSLHLLRNYTTGIAKTPQLETGAIGAFKFKQIKDYIEDNLASELSIETIANLVPMSQFHFARAFKSLTGEPPHRYILQRRIERAKVLLKVTQYSAAEIAYQVGFSNPSHFTSQFRKIVGATPKHFRESV
jgi:AraC family transcriptional regulator